MLKTLEILADKLLTTVAPKEEAAGACWVCVSSWGCDIDCCIMGGSNLWIIRCCRQPDNSCQCVPVEKC